MQPIGTFVGLDIGSSALTAAQYGEDIVGNNISNASTAGYADETVDSVEGIPNDAEMTPDAWNRGLVGTGVAVTGVSRSTDNFLDTLVRNSNADVANQQSQSNYLTAVETAFNEPGNTTINTTLTTFFSNFANVENNPSDNGVRTTAIQGGVALAQMIQSASQALTATSQQVGTAINNDVASINQYSQQIASINKAIQSAQNSGNGQANALLDQRDAIVNKLSSITNITTRTNPDGTDSISVGGVQLVSGAQSKTVTLAGLQQDGSLTSGDLYGLAQTQSNVSGYSTQLNNLASQVITQVNTIHEAGYGSDGSTGTPFFTGTDASDIAVNSALTTDPAKLAVASSLPSGSTTPAPGDAGNAAALEALGTATLGSSAGALSGTTFSSYYNGMITQLGSQDATASSNLTTAQASQTQVTNQQQSIEGVNEDDEMTNMMKYQNMYEAASKVVMTISSMLSEMITNLAPA